MFLVGLTGGIASGKSSVIQVFQQLGCAVIDVDVIARHVVQPGYPAHRRIVEAFGTEVLLENGDINRKVLGDLIFNQPDRRHLLNTITHPEIRKEMMKETFKYFLRGYRYVILDIPLLFETKQLLKYMAHTVVVYWMALRRLVRGRLLAQAEVGPGVLVPRASPCRPPRLPSESCHGKPGRNPLSLMEGLRHPHSSPHPTPARVSRGNLQPLWLLCSLSVKGLSAEAKHMP
ncbi:dephospho-CoA kinase domain-containing protein isoform X2 [Ursus arctos]|uniref:dephospho-CoA kinase domain-containing protein isoform X2 n=1 Tax=Ursus arctos TaxID=9644 RepID=UPI001CF8A833|nr:dephospho-CoA kinase domain-containing protein isoform X2 [Ursus arctos]